MAAAALLIVILQLPRPDSGAANDQEIETAVPLTADRTRDAGELTRVRIDSNSRIVRLVIPEELERFPEYRASLYRVEDDLRIAELNLPADWIQKGRNLPFPTELLPAGDYYVRMTGLPAGASAVPLKRYDFRVSRD
jgi:hypothetical protein